MAWNGRVVLDDVAVHVDDIQRAVGTGQQIDRAKPLFGGSQELRLLVGHRALGHVADPFRPQNTAMNQILRVVDAEVISLVLSGERIATVNCLAAGRGEVAVGGRFHFAIELHPLRIRRALTSPGIWQAARIDAGWMAITADVASEFWR